MRRKSFIVVVATLLLLAGTRSAPAQEDDADELKFEVGAHVTALGVDRFEADDLGNALCINIFPCFVSPPRRERRYEPGFGGRVGYNFNRHVGVEAEVNFFPGEQERTGGRKIEGLFGVKAGRRFERVGVFAKARPGFLRESRGDFEPGTNPCILIFPTPPGCFDAAGKTSFALDVGGVLEIYPTRRTFIRFDAGDTVVSRGERDVVVELSPPPGSSRPTLLVVNRQASETTHNFQGSVGVGFRF